MTTQDDIAALKAATREAHEAIRDLRTTLKEVKDIRAGVPAAVHTEVEAILERETTRQLDELAKVVRRQMDSAVAQVGRSFERLERIFLGQENDGEDLELLARRAVARREQRTGMI